MAIKNRFRLNIKMKLMIVLLGISLISILLFAAVSFFQMKSLGRFSLDSSISLGDQAIEDSAKALNNAASRSLLRLVADQAALSNAMLEKVCNNVDIMATFATRIWLPQHPLKTDSAKWPVKSPHDEIGGTSQLVGKSLGGNSNVCFSQFLLIKPLGFGNVPFGKVRSLNICP